MTIIYVLAVIGALCLLHTIGFMIFLIIEVHRDKSGGDEDMFCALTGEHCIYSGKNAGNPCDECPVRKKGAIDEN